MIGEIVWTDEDGVERVWHVELERWLDEELER